MKRCPTCSSDKPLADFYKDKRTPDGLKSQCKHCHTSGSIRTRDTENARRLSRESNARSRSRNPEKWRERERVASKVRGKTARTEARKALNLAVRSGRLSRPAKCSRCQSPGKLNAHHNDYAKPLEVEWLCTLCHGKEHRHA